MAMVREWTQQAARATGVSLLAPIVLLVTAAAVASGGGLGGLSALGQAAGGPALPDLGIQATATGAGTESLADADIVGADASAPPAPATSPGAAGSGPLASGPGGAGNVGTPGSEPVDVSPLPPAAAPPQQTAPVSRAPSAPAPGGGAAPADPVGDVIENTRGIGGSLPGPLGPTTGDILDLLLPPSSP